MQKQFWQLIMYFRKFNSIRQLMFVSKQERGHKRHRRGGLVVQWPMSARVHLLLQSKQGSRQMDSLRFGDQLSQRWMVSHGMQRTEESSTYVCRHYNWKITHNFCMNDIKQTTSKWRNCGHEWRMPLLSNYVESNPILIIKCPISANFHPVKGP